MNEIIDFLKEAKTFYLASVEDGKPRVRPFGFCMGFEGRIYFCTGAKKPVFAQMQANPWVEATAMGPGMKWLRVSGRAVFDDRPAAKARAFKLAPSLERIYKGGAADEDFRVFYLEEVEAVLYGIGVPAKKLDAEDHE